VTEFGSDTAPDIDPERFAAWFTAQWADPGAVHVNVSPRCHQVRRDVLAAAGLDHRRPVADPGARFGGSSRLR
jgi:hypothetical protein